MLMLSRARKSLVPVALAALLLAGAPAAATGPQSAHQQGDDALRILLTNDDGYDREFIVSLGAKLEKAGHEVTLVAPKKNQSGVGTKVTFDPGGVIEAEQVEEDVWWIDGSPADAVAFGLGVVFAEDQPDLVISGPNYGQNVGAVVNHSGTVGATITAISRGLPAIAVSAEVNLADDDNRYPTGEESAEFTVDLVERLQETARDGRLLPEYTALNVNYPTHPNGETAFAEIGRSSFISQEFVADPDACARCYRLVPIWNDGPDPVRNSDVNLLRQGHVTITPVDGDWAANSAVTGQLRGRLAGLNP